MKIVDGCARVFELLRYRSRFSPEDEVVTCSVGGVPERLTWRELEARSMRLATACTRLGVGRGDVVAVLATNSHRFLETVHAVTGLGAIVLLLAPQRDMQQLRYAVHASSPKLIFADAAMVDRACALQGHLPSLKVIVMGGSGPIAAFWPPDATSYEALLECEDGSVEWVDVHEDAPCALGYVLGRFGQLKCRAYSHRGAVLEALVAGRADVPRGAGETVLAAIPMSNTARPWGLWLPLGLDQARLVLPGPCSEPAAIRQMIDTHRVTTLSALPGLCRALLTQFDAGAAVPTTLKQISCGGLAPRGVVERRLAQRYGIRVIRGAGSWDQTPIGVFGGSDPAFALKSEIHTRAAGRTWISGVMLESLAVLHPEIAEAAVVDFGSSGGKSRRMLIVVRKPETALTAAQLHQFIDLRVPAGVRPDIIEMSSAALPRLPSDLVDKRTLHDLYFRRAWRGDQDDERQRLLG